MRPQGPNRRSAFARRLPPVLVVLALAAAVVTATAAAEAQRRQFEDTTDVVLVEVPVQVLRDGEPVRNLTAADFEIFDGRKKQEIVGFEVIDLKAVTTVGGPAVPELPIAARRHFLLLFDLSFADPTAVVKARSAATELVLSDLHPSDLVAVATYSESRGPNLVLGFTSDRRQVEAAIADLGFANPLQSTADPLGIVFADLGESPLGPGGGDGGGLSGINRDAEFLEQLRDLSNLNAQAVRAQRQAQIEALSSSLTQIADLMNSVSGRKHVVYLSEGFDASIVLGSSGTTNEEQAQVRETADAAASGEFWKVDSEERFGSTATLNVLSGMLEAFKRADCTIQAVDIGGLRAGGAVQGGGAESGSSSRGQDGLFMMANETGGELYRNFNDLGDAMEQMLERTSVTYVLAFQPRDLELDGKFNRLKVEVKGQPRGTRVVHRPGYFAPKPYSQLSGLEKRLRTAEAIVGGPEGGVLGTWVLAAAVPVPGQRAYVPVLVEVSGSDLLAGQRGDVVPLEIYAYALDRTGIVKDFFSQPLGLDRAQAEAALRQTGFKFWGHFDLDPGDYIVRVMARNSETGVAGLDSVPLRVPSPDSSEVSLLPPLFPEPAGKWLMGREQREDQRQVPYPFLLDGQPVIPAARPVLTAGVMAQVLLQGYSLSETVTVVGRVLGVDGSAVEGGTLEVSQRTRAGAADQLLATFRPDGLAAGEYVLEVTVTDAESGDSTVSSVPIVVGG